MKVATDMSECQKAWLRGENATKTKKDEGRKRGENNSSLNPHFIPEQEFPTCICNLRGMQELCLQLGEAARGVTREGTVARRALYVLWANVISEDLCTAT